MEVEKLSDQQLYTLIKDKSLSYDVKSALEIEFNKRDFSIQYVDELSLVHEKINTNDQIDLSLSNKLLIIVFPWIVPIQAIIANRYIATGNKKKWKQHWSFVGVGIIFWLVVIIILARLFLFKKTNLS